MNIKNEETIKDSNLTNYYRSFTNVTGDAYIQLMTYLFEKSQQFILVIRYDIILNDDINKIMEDLSPFLIKKVRQSCWANTDLCCEDYDSQTIVHYFTPTKEALEIILNNTNNLFQWVQPSFPEDISFLIDGEYIFTSTAHEIEYMFIDIPKSRIYGESGDRLSLLDIRTYSRQYT